jgi:protein TonB
MISGTEETMFQETLLESSAIHHRPRRWPKATAFAVQLLLVGVLVVVPLFSTKIIALANPSMPVPLTSRAPVSDSSRQQSSSSSSDAQSPSPREVVEMHSGKSIFPHGTGPVDPKVEDGSIDPPCLASHCVPGNASRPNLRGDAVKPPRLGKPVVFSHMDPGMLIHEVVPTYPHTAVAINLQGEVKLHAIIARDGTIQSLSVISGHPLLTRAALEAVQQWRYRPYVLNGEPVEVDTYITVNFRRN